MPDSTNPSPTQEVETIERFEIQQDADEAAKVSEHGPWVRFEDHKAALQAEIENREEVEAALTDLQCEQANERLAAESRLSSVEARLTEERDFAEEVPMNSGRAQFCREVLQLLRDKGTEQKGFDYGCPRRWYGSHCGRGSVTSSTPGVCPKHGRFRPGERRAHFSSRGWICPACDGTGGQRLCVAYPDGRMCGEPAVERLTFAGRKEHLDLCAPHLDDLLKHHCLRPRSSTQQDQPEVAIEQGADDFDFRDPRTEIEPWENEHAKELAKELGIPVDSGAGVAIEGDPGLEDGGVEEGAEELIRSMIGRNERLCVCASAGTVIGDQQKPTPYPVDGCLVGVATGADAEGFWLTGVTFATRVKWADLRGAWLRNAAPDPCPHCGAATASPLQQLEQSTTDKEDCER